MRRLCLQAGVLDLEVSRPIRLPRGSLVKESGLEKALNIARTHSPLGVIVFLDADDDCPKDLAVKMRSLAGNSASDLHVEIVVVNREFEAWFLAALPSLCGKRGIPIDATFLGDPEAVRDAKATLSKLKPASQPYMPTSDQAALAASMDLALAWQRSRSFRRAVSAFGACLQSANKLHTEWPPVNWTA